MIGQPAGGLLLADERILQARFRALSVAWIAFGPYSGDQRLRITARAAQAAAVSLPIGTFATNPAASAAQRSAAEAVRAFAGTGQNSYDAIFAAISEAFSAEAQFLDDARCVWALDQDIEFLSGGNPSFLASVPLWLNQPPTWAQQRWQDLKAMLHNAGQDWQVWTIWYDDRLDGRVRSIERELAMVKLRGTGEHRVEALRLAEAFRARVIDATTESFVFEITGNTAKINQFIDLMRPLGLVEVSRTGVAAIGRGAEGM